MSAMLKRASQRMGKALNREGTVRDEKIKVKNKQKKKTDEPIEPSRTSMEAVYGVKDDKFEVANPVESPKGVKKNEASLDFLRGLEFGDDARDSAPKRVSMRKSLKKIMKGKK